MDLQTVLPQRPVNTDICRVGARSIQPGREESSPTKHHTKIRSQNQARLAENRRHGNGCAVAAKAEQE